jgi:hypothetical protein
MVAIRYTLTREDFAELESECRGGILRRTFRILGGSFIGLIGLFTIWQVNFFFPRHHGSVLITAMGVVCLWAGFECPGLAWVFNRLSDPYAECELAVHPGKLSASVRGKTREFRWLPRRGFKESQKFFILEAFGSDGKWTIPKRALTAEQESRLRHLVDGEPTGTPVIECGFFLTPKDLEEASSAEQPLLGSRYGRIMLRIGAALSTLVLPWIMWRLGKSWIDEFKHEPAVAAFLAGYELFMLWTATGCIGLKTLRRFDLPRRIRISDLEVASTRGEKISRYNWKRFLYYRETENLFVLHTLLKVEFVTIPKKALHVDDQSRLRSLLSEKLPRRAQAARS